MLKVFNSSCAACLLVILLSACSLGRQIARFARPVINDSSLQHAHVGISVFDPTSNRYLYQYQGEKYFVPASNTKIPTCYVAMKYLGDSLRGLDYLETDTVVFIRPTADPSFLHRDFPEQPVFEFLQGTRKKIALVPPAWETEVYGSGWSWNDYNEPYMAERSGLPIYGNVIEFRLTREQNAYTLNGDINFFRRSLNSHLDSITPHLRIRRRRTDNTFDIFPGRGNFSRGQFPFLTFENQRLLEDTLRKTLLDKLSPPIDEKFKIVYSQATDTLLKIMMHRSDNFFAEQVLLMVSNEKLGLMNEAKIIDTILKTDFKDLSLRPRWTDGSGLSRYNLFTPTGLVSILDKMKNEFGMERIKIIFPTGNRGTLTNYYKADSGFIFAKTGTLSGVVALSGYLYTKKKRLLIFSVLVNNHQASATAIRRVVEKFIQKIR